MGINELKLTPELITAWYPDILVTSRNQAPADENVKSRNSQQSQTIVESYLGKNLRSLCVLVESPDDVFMPGEQLVFLQKILAACKYSLDDIALINICRNPVTMDDLKNQFHPDIIFLWGNLPVIAGFPEPMPDLTVTTWGNIKLLYVAQADIMSKDGSEAQALKRILWNVLQKMFSL
jgi:hypothetical protein